MSGREPNKDEPAPPAKNAHVPAQDINIFGKTRMCIFHEQGRCAHGETCTYAHDAGELKPFPVLAGTKMCRTVKEGGLCMSANCKFAHSQADKVRLPNSERVTRPPGTVRPKAAARGAAAAAPPPTSSRTAIAEPRNVEPAAVASAAMSAGWLLRAVDASNDEAQLHRNAMDLAARSAPARCCCEQAACAGDAQAQHDLAQAYLRGVSHGPDYAAAVMWFQMAAARGHSGASAMLASLGEGLIGFDDISSDSDDGADGWQ
eukprot:NODE_6987_length_1619_cov_4.065013.p1 GENE.NODE_6987_length_1619_cov_4.065013~~NODE_6987_length_1619_cov_4.065013.p1  ORF type:complete len:260 (+),score=61.49 NODE_6987_length_1619_cov_4.065013:114-893(+)